DRPQSFEHGEVAGDADGEGGEDDVERDREGKLQPGESEGVELHGGGLLLHDLLEDLPETQVDEIRWIDNEGNQVVNLVLEVTKQREETKVQYLQRVLDWGSKNALLLKCADRISNLTDLHRDTQTPERISIYLDQTEQYVIPMAKLVNPDMVIELTDLVERRRRIKKMMEGGN
ncbi:MAG TPA: hypothetical protein VFB86_02325, partial [Bacteroidales bacterium]|nr:hypothetical protein [Bacteroidales bacterium]